MKQHLLFMSAVSLLFFSCAKVTDSSDFSDTSLQPIHFSLHEIETRVVNNQFERDDSIIVQATLASQIEASTPQQAIYKYIGESKFESADPLMASSQGAGSVAMDYLAIYPSVETLKTNFDFSIATDQSTKIGYEQSDFLLAKIAGATSHDLDLTFQHTMANVIIDVEILNNGVPSTEKGTNFTIHAQHQVTCDLDAEQFVAKGEAIDIRPSGSGSSFNVIVAPQELGVNAGFAKMMLGGQSVVMLNDRPQHLESGKCYEIKWTVDRVTGSQKVEITSTIGAWEDGIWNTTPEPPVTDTTTTATPLFLDITQSGLTIGSPAVTGAPLVSKGGYAVEFLYDQAPTLANAPHYQATNDGSIEGVKMTNNCQMKVTSTTPITSIQFKFFQLNAQEALNANVVVGDKGKLVKGTVGSGGPKWSMEEGATEITFSFKGVTLVNGMTIN